MENTELLLQSKREMGDSRDMSTYINTDYYTFQDTDGDEVHIDTRNCFLNRVREGYETHYYVFTLATNRYWEVTEETYNDLKTFMR
jgi:hypothetical protein